MVARLRLRTGTYSDFSDCDVTIRGNAELGEAGIQPGELFLYLEAEDGSIAAWLTGRTGSRPGCAYLSAMWADPHWRGHGLALRLVRAFVRWARAEGYRGIWTYTIPENCASANTLIRAGFRFGRPSAFADRSVVWFFKTLD